MPITVDDMARAGCTTTRGIRYWEKEGLLGEVERSSGNQRRYTQEQLDRAKIIAAAQFGGWNLDDAKKMVNDYDQEAFEALLHRLDLQATTAAMLAEGLPTPAGMVTIEQTEQQVYDL